MGGLWRSDHTNENHSGPEDTDKWFAILFVLAGIALTFVMAMILNGIYFGVIGDQLGLPFVAFAWFFLFFSI